MPTANTAKPGGRQPKKQQLKNKVAIRKRAQKAIKLLAQGDSVQAAGIKIGYTGSYADRGVRALLRNPVVQQDIASILASAGVTDTAIAEKIRSLMSATSPRYMGKYVGIVDVPDNTTQLNATSLAAKLKGHMIDRSLNLNVNVDCSPVDLSKYRSKRPLSDE
jgi:hypothetical protein